MTLGMTLVKFKGPKLEAADWPVAWPRPNRPRIRCSDTAELLR